MQSTSLYCKHNIISSSHTQGLWTACIHEHIPFCVSRSTTIRCKLPSCIKVLPVTGSTTAASAVLIAASSAGVVPAARAFVTVLPLPLPLPPPLPLLSALPFLTLPVLLPLPPPLLLSLPALVLVVLPELPELPKILSSRPLLWFEEEMPLETQPQPCRHTCSAARLLSMLSRSAFILIKIGAVCLSQVVTGTCKDPNEIEAIFKLWMMYKGNTKQYIVTPVSTIE